MDHILQKVVGSSRLLMIDGFSRYNQRVVRPDDQKKTTFTAPWETFMYANMPFGLMNVGAIFQRDMNIAFVGEKDKFLVIYLNDIKVFSKYHDENLEHLQ